MLSREATNTNFIAPSIIVSTGIQLYTTLKKTYIAIGSLPLKNEQDILIN
jgi:hypothetical protein